MPSRDQRREAFVRGYVAMALLEGAQGPGPRPVGGLAAAPEPETVPPADPPTQRPLGGAEATWAWEPEDPTPEVTEDLPVAQVHPIAPFLAMRAAALRGEDRVEEDAGPSTIVGALGLFRGEAAPPAPTAPVALPALDLDLDLEEEIRQALAAAAQGGLVELELELEDLDEEALDDEETLDPRAVAAHRGGSDAPAPDFAAAVRWALRRDGAPSAVAGVDDGAVFDLIDL